MIGGVVAEGRMMGGVVAEGSMKGGEQPQWRAVWGDSMTGGGQYGREQSDHEHCTAGSISPTFPGQEQPSSETWSWGAELAVLGMDDCLTLHCGCS